MVNMGAIMSASLLLYMVKPEMSVSEKFEFVQDFFVRMAGGEHVGFQNSVLYSCGSGPEPSGAGFLVGAGDGRSQPRPRLLHAGE